MSTPAAPRSSALPNRISTICLPVRLGKACAISATAPLIVGAEKLVPDHRNWVPVWSGARSLTPPPSDNNRRRFRLGRRSSAMLRAVGVERAGDDHRARGIASPGSSANGSGLAVPSLPAAMTITMPAFTARCIAPSSVEPGAEPPSERLMTLAPALRAASIPRAIASSKNEQPSFGRAGAQGRRPAS